MNGPSHKLTVEPNLLERVGGRALFARLRSESGQSMVEFALVMPFILLLIVAVVKFGIVLNSYLTMTDTVRTEARVLSVDRGQIGGCLSVKTKVATAENVDPSAVHITFNNDGLPVQSYCDLTGLDPNELAPGEAATIQVTKSCDLKLFHLNLPCSITVSDTERIE